MSQSIQAERTETLQEVCEDNTALQHAKEICSRESVVMDERGNIISRSITHGDGLQMLYRKKLVLGTGDWEQHSLSEANQIVHEAPDSNDPNKIETFINDKLQQ